MLSQTGEYALRAVLYVAAHEGRDGLVKIDEIAAELDVPRNTLAKTLHALGRAGVLGSVRGPAGGFHLAVPAEALTLARVVAPFDAVGQGRVWSGGQARQQQRGQQHKTSSHAWVLLLPNDSARNSATPCRYESSIREIAQAMLNPIIMND